MAPELKSWESPRHQGRNSKGKGGSARQRQLKKQRQMLIKKLKGETPNQNKHKRKKEKRTSVLFSFYLDLFFVQDLSPTEMCSHRSHSGLSNSSLS